MVPFSPTLLVIPIVTILALVMGILIGRYGVPNSSKTTTTFENEELLAIEQWKNLSKNFYDKDDGDDPVYRALLDGPDPERIRKNIKFLSIEPHQAGSDRDNELAQFFKNSFLEAGLDRAYLQPYKVLLSYDDPERPNKIYLTDKSSDMILVMAHQEPPLRPDDGNVPAYNGYAPSGDIVGEPVYCNYGRDEDFELLEDEARIDLTDKICLIRYGRIFRGNKISNAKRFGCSAVIFFTDPETMAPFNQNDSSVYPNSIWMNGKAMQSGTIYLDEGDPLTPGFPSVPDGYREEITDKEFVHLPSIPSQPIGYDDAKLILSHMSGLSCDDNIKFQEWIGKLNVTYRLGPGFRSPTQQLRMVINNRLVEKVIYNVIGVLDGSVEPDRFVLVGNHRDAWSYGAMDAASGGASMLETIKSFGAYHKETGWRPRRSLVFASWAAEELGMIGSTEWTEEFKPILERDLIAYINVDTCVYGPLIKPDASPSLATILLDTIKRIPSHLSDALIDLNRTLYDDWSELNQIDKVDVISSGSDQMAFVFGNGIPSINLHFKHDKRKFPVSGYPAYHTSYETFYLVEKFIDPEFRIHQSCSRLINLLLYSISSSTLIPLDFHRLSGKILDDYIEDNLDARLLKIIDQNDSDELKSLEFLRSSMKKFSNATKNGSCFWINLSRIKILLKYAN
ncbi:N-acetylated-alpha-linked acidic dipeptidase 2 [Sarcoptes scabiei]|uniref:N-acetylated-alpha-linked acidic dipeptidase 2 n=1 Tax=Sarcoptes scabiei TaxID=52283 RepID=A0A834R746_SARSC|nr:N-acetylated-alpha-linked acidic dipeptidase 2 [Sarcoptes scabiei]